MSPITPRVRRTQTVNKGDLFKDNDPRNPAPRIVRVLRFTDPTETFFTYAEKAVVEVVEHWDETQIGQTHKIRVSRLAKGRYRKNGYTKVSR